MAQAGGHRARPRLMVALVALVLAAGVAIVACGGGDDGGGGGGATDRAGEGGGGPARGGEITIAYGSQPDYMDPALAYSPEAWEALPTAYTPLVTYRHVAGEAGAELIPGLAEALPEISANGRTYRLTLRDGLEFSDGTPVKASDFEHTIKRVLNLESGGAPFFEIIVGAKQYEQAGKPNADIPGIETDDGSRTVTIRLDKADASFANVLAMDFAGLVPGDTPFKNMTEDPPPGVGPYEITESVPNRQFVLERNPGFARFEIPDIPTGNLDKITVRIVKSGTRQAQDVLDNKLDYMFGAPPADYLPRVREQAGDRFRSQPVPSTRYIFMNTEVPPFDDPLVRQAASYAIDKPALARLFAGELQPGCAFLPPGMPGYDEALDTTDCPYGDPTQPPDLERARALLRQAGAEGAKVTVWGESGNPIDKVTQAYADMLNRIGLDAEVKLLDPGVHYQTIGNERTQAQTGPDSWFEDFPHPLNFYYLVDGDSIQPTNNQNFSKVDDPRIDAEIDRLRLEPDLESVADDWTALDRYLVSPPHSYVAPYGHAQLATFFSERMDFDDAVFHPIFLNDYTTWALKESR